MGLILSRIYDKPSTRDTLEKIEQEIQNIEERRWDKIKREQFIVQILSFIPITILIANICILIYPSDSSWRDKLILSIPIVILNLILWLSRRVVQWYSRWSLDNEEARLRKLQKEKKKILEMVCETESYRVATELLEKYDPKQLRRREKNVERPASPLNTTLTKITASPNRSPQAQLRLQQQHQQQTLQSPLSIHNQSLSFPIQVPQLSIPAPPPPTPINKPPPSASKPQLNLNTTMTTTATAHNTSIAAPIAASSVQGRPVRPVLSKDRTLFERLVDWVVADGPDNRFALICRYCYGHNGMSLAEEYETINFRCCYCYNLNTATNKRSQVHDQLQPDRERSESNPKSEDVNSKEKEQQHQTKKRQKHIDQAESANNTSETSEIKEDLLENIMNHDDTMTLTDRPTSENDDKPKTSDNCDSKQGSPDNSDSNLAS